MTHFQSTRLLSRTLAMAQLLCVACAPDADDDRALNPENAEVEVSAQALTNVKIMVVGDSISQGLEGDYSWRYRLWEHLAGQGVNAQLVGPWTGTNKLGPPQGAGAPPSHAGAYRPGISSSFPKGNLAEWGWMMGEAKWVIADHMKTYGPSVLLVELGFNDIAWNLSDTPAPEVANGVLTSLGELVQNARAVNPNVKVLVADAPQRTPIASYPELPGKISAYNNKLDGVIADLTRATSPVHRVYFDLLYDQARDSYDGIHPNVRGEYVIAKAFADELAKKLGIGAIMSLPASMPADLRPGPTGAMTISVNADYSADLSWPHVFGAGGYLISTRDVSAGEASFRLLPFPIGADGWHPTSLPAGHRIEYKLQTARGDYASGSSPVGSLVTKALPAVSFTAQQSSSNGIKVTWSPVAGADDYHVYASSDCSGSSTPTGGYQLVQWALGGKTSWTQTFINTRCMNYYVVASKNGGESPKPAVGLRVNMADCFVDDFGIPSGLTNANAFAMRTRSSCTSDYGAIVARLVGNRYTAPTPISVVFVAKPYGYDPPVPGAASGSEVQANYNYVNDYPNDHGMLLHELTHLVQAYPVYAAPWSEGIADWIRYDMGEPPPGHQGGTAANCLPNAHYTDGYQCTAAFLEWVRTTYNYPIVQQVNELLHAGNTGAVEPTFQLVTNRTMAQLWAACRQSVCAGGRP